MPRAPRWTPICKQLTRLQPPELLELLHELFKSSEQARAFLSARFAEANLDALIEPYRRRILDQFRFHPSSMTVRLDLAAARRAIREYRQATGDLFGTAELMMAYVEAGTQHVADLGDSDVRVYNSLESVLGELTKLLQTNEGRPMYPIFRDRLNRVAEIASECGYGYGDSAGAAIHQLADALRDS